MNNRLLWRAGLALACATLATSCSKDVAVRSTDMADEALSDAQRLLLERTSVVDFRAERPNAFENTRVITLDNGLDALLISDPSVQKSAAALDVGVGSLADPWEHLGMAHFLEHMLFLGTEKYPDVGEYDEYLSQNGGSNNAYTSSENTNYLFEINHDAFDGALDRFAQFFIAPRMDAEYVDREMNAVNSEHVKNIQDDGWRTRMVQRYLHREGHPRQRFSTGNLETLESVTRDQMMEFYQTHYSANLMKLCVMSNQPLDALEASVREKFSPIPNRGLERPEYPSDVFDADDLPQLIQVRPIADLRQLTLEFATPPLYDLYRSKPHLLIGSVLGYEGEGSLLSRLKTENLATGLGASGWSETYTGYFNIGITLTEKGRANVERVLELTFAYLSLMREKGLEEYYFADEQTVSDLNYFYREPEEGWWAVSGYASSMQEYPADEFEERERLLYEYDPTAYTDLLGHLRPERVRVTLVAPDVETDQVEQYYGAEYGVSRFADDVVARWAAARPTDDMAFPAKNPFIPDDLTLLDDPSQEAPREIIDDHRGTFWFEQDARFDVPKARVSILLQTPETNSTARDRLLAELYVRAVEESWNEWAYQVAEAGLGIDMDADSRGIRLRLNGYSQRIPDLIRAVGERLTTITIDEDAFGAITDQLARSYANADFDQAYQQTFYEFNYLLISHAHHRRDYRDLIDSVTLAEVRDYASTLFATSAIEGSAYGNLDGGALRSALDDLYATVSSATLAEADRIPVLNDNMLDAGEYGYVFSTKSDNNCWLDYVQFGERSTLNEAVLRYVDAYVDSRFYAEMRTQQQLGYIVFAGPRLQTRSVGMYFLIQSGEYPATELATRAHTFLDTLVPGFRDLTDEEFDGLRAAILAILAEEDTDMSERLSTLAYEGLALEGAFDWKDRVAEAVTTLTRDQVADAFERAFADGETASLAVYLDADGAPTSEPIEPAIADVVAFKTAAKAF